jgi:hypothetical protein
MNSEMHFLPTMYAQDHHQLQHASDLELYIQTRKV